MECSPQVREYLIDVGSDMDDVSSGRTPTDDQFFLLYFIMGTYFGPDLKGETSQKSVFQRRAEGLPPYTHDKLAGSCMKTVEVERIYYYVLRKADRSVVLKLPWLHQFFHGNLSTSTRSPTLPFPQFDDLFPPHLHPHSIFKGQYEVINNIVFISDPKILYIGQEYIERFKRLTRLEDLCLERDDAKLHTTVDGKVLYNIDVQEKEFHEELRQTSSSGSEETRPSSPLSKPEGSLPANSVPYRDTAPIDCVLQNKTQSGCVEKNGAPVMCSSADCLPEMKLGGLEQLTSDLIFLPSRPSREDWINILTATKSGCALTGSAAIGQIGPILGRVDIGECEDSYLFRVSLPGVKRDEREFSCEVEDDGKVSIRGVTVTGEKAVYRYDQTFEMQSQKLCPSGHFSISFKLPGPVDPQQFSGNFGTDGILEGIVMKGLGKPERDKLFS